MVLTPKQTVQVAAAPASQKAALRAMYTKQNSGTVPGVPRDRKQRAAASRLQSMPAPSRVPRGVQPDMSKGNWDQTPASSNVIAPRGFGYYDAFEHNPFDVATHMSIGPATPIVGTTICSSGLVTKAPANFTAGPALGLESGAILLIVHPSTGKVQATAFHCSNTTGSAFCGADKYISPQLEADPPDNAIPTRCSLRLRNWTQHVGVGGIVRTLRMTTGVALRPGYTTNEELAILCENIRNHARTRTYGGDELCETHQKNCTVVDQSKATWFRDWDALTPNHLLPWTAAAGWPQGDAAPNTETGAFDVQLHDPSYTPIAILFEPFVAAVSGSTVGNKYEVSVRSQFLAHYAQGTMLANMAVDPANEPGQLSNYRDREEAKGSILENIANAIKGGASWSWNHRGELAKVGGMAWQASRAAKFAV